MSGLLPFRSRWWILGIIGLAISHATSLAIPKGSVKNEDDSWMHSKTHTKRSIQTSKNGNPLQNFGSKTLKYEDETHWFNHAQDSLRGKLRQRDIETQAKNLIIYIGDGMSNPTVTAARIYKGQLEGQYGEEGSLYFETFPNIAMSKTFCSDSQVADSACSATAYLCGSKTNIDTIGVSPRVVLNDCAGQNKPENQLSSILSWAQEVGKSTGIISTARITHASPAGTYAHTSNRDFEHDAKVKEEGEDPETCDDIAEQLILNKPGQDINVILGGGRRYFRDKNVEDEETKEPGLRTDGKDLISDWIKGKSGKNAQFITGKYELSAIDPENTDYLLGLFSPDHLPYQDEEASASDPSLAEMVEAALKILSKNPNGFFLFVEGGRIDHAHHDNYAHRALVETLEFEKSVRMGDLHTDDTDTLLVVTADHSHVMTFNGYPDRGTDILLVAGTDEGDLPYSTLSYTNGPGYRVPKFSKPSECSRGDIKDDPFEDPKYRQEAMVHLSSETHGGDDVVIYAKGPFSHLFSGIQDQTYIPHVMAYAACIGSGETFCDSISNF